MSNFDLHEFDCKCDCGKNNIKTPFLQRLDRARELSGVPYVINSGCRCEAHNTAVGGAADSAHLDGWAADIACVSSRPRFKILYGALRAGFTRIGIGRTFIHLDSDVSKPPMVTWLY